MNGEIIEALVKLTLVFLVLWAAILTCGTP